MRKRAKPSRKFQRHNNIPAMCTVDEQTAEKLYGDKRRMDNCTTAKPILRGDPALGDSWSRADVIARAVS